MTVCHQLLSSFIYFVFVSILMLSCQLSHIWPCDDMAASRSLSCVNNVFQRKLEDRAAEVARLAEEKKKNARLQRRK